MTRVHEPHAPLVYYVQRDGLVKIGTTTRFRGRMAALRVDELLAVEPGSYDLEDKRHAQFAEHHVRGDWFEPAPVILAHAAALAAVHELPKLPGRGRTGPPIGYVAVEPVALDRSDERWGLIPGTDGDYEVSTHGRVWSRPRPGARGGGIIAGSIRTDGYRQLKLNCPSRKEIFRVQVLVALVFIGPRPAGLVVCHKDGNRLNNYLSNIKYDTYSANAEERVLHGRHWQAEKTHCDNNHEFTPENTRLRRDGCRTCRQCERDRNGWQGGVASDLREACPAGHDYTEANTYINPTSGHRTCRTCHREQVLASQHAARDAERGRKAAHVVRWRPADLSERDAAHYDLYVRWLGGEKQVTLLAEAGIAQSSLSRTFRRFTDLITQEQARVPQQLSLFSDPIAA